MDGTAELSLAEDGVDEAVLLDKAEPSEVAGDDARREVDVVGAFHLGAGARNPALDPFLNFGGSWH